MCHSTSQTGWMSGFGGIPEPLPRLRTAATAKGPSLGSFAQITRPDRVFDRVRLLARILQPIIPPRLASRFLADMKAIPA